MRRGYSDHEVPDSCWTPHKSIERLQARQFLHVADPMAKERNSRSRSRSPSPKRIRLELTREELPDPAVLANLQLPIIPAEEARNATLAASESLGNPGGEEVPPAPVLKAGTSHNPAKGSAGKATCKGEAASTRKKKPEQPSILGEGLPTVPAKLAGRIHRGEFVKMAELLQDNIEAERWRGSVPDNTCAGGVEKARQQREVPDLLSWVQCFGVYACVVASKHPDKIREMMAYQTTIICEARRCGGAGWQGYDNMFRQHATNLPNIDWSKVNNSLFAVTFMAQQNSRGKNCELCLEPDHTVTECALAPSKPREPPTQRQPAGLGIVPAGQRRAGPSREWRSRDEYSGPRGQAASKPPADRSDRVCYSWNDGTCRFINCRYRHECARCGGDHRAVECPLHPPPTSRPRQGPNAPQRGG
jgi:hypothetical protein